MTTEDSAPRRLRRAEAVLARRSGRILLVVEACALDHNFQAVLRTAEGFGVQHVWLVDDPLDPRTRRGVSNAVTRGAHRWLSLRRFDDAAACLAALRADRRDLWASDVGAAAEALAPARLAPLPARLALAIGSEARGLGPELLAAAARRLRLPMQGFADSFNLGVATGLFLQRLFDACPEARGDLTAAERAELRRSWYAALAHGEARRAEFDAYATQPPPPAAEVVPDEALRRPRMKERLLRRYRRPSAAESE